MWLYFWNGSRCAFRSQNDSLHITSQEDFSLNFYQRVYEAVKKIPCGKVTTYGQIALMAGSPRASRVVGGALHRNPTPGEVPCHRVVNREGRLAPDFAFGGPDVQKMLLEAEGVAVSSAGLVDLSQYLWMGGE